MSFWLGIGIGWLIGVFGTGFVIALCSAASERRMVIRLRLAAADGRLKMVVPNEGYRPDEPDGQDEE